MNVGNLIQITAATRFAGNEMRNIFHYEVTAVTGDPALSDVLTTFEADVVPDMANVIVGGAYIYSLHAENLTDETTIADLDMGTDHPGTRAGDAMPMFNALGIKLIRTNKTTRQGQKRFSPVSETDSTAGVFSAGLVTAAEALGAALVADLEVDDGAGNTATLIPVIYGEALPERPSKRGGTLPARPSAMNPVSGYTVNPLVTSQVTRKPGRGV